MKEASYPHPDEPLAAGQYYFNETDLSRVHPQLALSCFQLEELRKKKIYVHDLYKIRTLVGILLSGALAPSEKQVTLPAERIAALYVCMTGPGWNVDPLAAAPLLDSVYSAFRPPFLLEDGDQSEDGDELGDGA